MDEYIKRGEPLQYLKNQCKECDVWNDDQMCANCGVKNTIRMIKQLPAANVEPVIRCKDCEHSKELLDYDGRNLYCLIWGRGFPKVLPDDFCSHGERREPNGLE